jgi:hypothetical protein
LLAGARLSFAKLERAAVQGKILPVPSARIHKRGAQ